MLEEWWKEKIGMRLTKVCKHPYAILEDDARKSLLIIFQILVNESPREIEFLSVCL
jgi:hypothetical protein